MAAREVTCLFCNREVRDHDAIVVIEHDGERETSLVREPELLDRRGALVVHAECARCRRLKQTG